MARPWALAISLQPLAILAACSPGATPANAQARNLLLITIDTLRADHVGAYGYARAHTPTLDAIARSGAVFERAYAAAPITLPSHATIMSGRYPPGHGVRDNGMRASASTPTLAAVLRERGFKTAAFVAAFPLDHQFGLDRGFDVYSDRMGRDAQGHQEDERPASQVVDEAIAWLNSLPAPGAALAPGFFVWIHLFEPHAPYGTDPSRPVLDRYDEEISTADREAGRLIRALGSRAAATLIVAAGDHGEAFGEHGEYAHSIFVYDTTLQVPFVMSGPGVTAGRRVAAAVTLADLAPTAATLLGIDLKDVDGVNLAPALGSPAVAIAARELYAESFAPLIEFGWAPLRSIRSNAMKYIAAPRAELYDVEHDAAEQHDLTAARPAQARTLDTRIGRYSGDAMPTMALGPTSAERTEQAERTGRPGSLGDSAGSAIRNPQSAMSRPDPKDRRAMAARIAQLTSGELTGAALLTALEDLVRDDPGNGLAHMRLGSARLNAGDCARAEPEFQAAARSGLTSADVFLGLAMCLGQRRDLTGAAAALGEAERLEPGNPLVKANTGILKANQGDLPGAIAALTAALSIDPGILEARFNLALAYAETGRTAEAVAAAQELLKRLPPQAPQRAEVQRLLSRLGQK